MLYFRKYVGLIPLLRIRGASVVLFLLLLKRGGCILNFLVDNLGSARHTLTLHVCLSSTGVVAVRSAMSWLPALAPLGPNTQRS
jgi:hypothetical protein